MSIPQDNLATGWILQETKMLLNVYKNHPFSLFTIYHYLLPIYQMTQLLNHSPSCDVWCVQRVFQYPTYQQQTQAQALKPGRHCTDSVQMSGMAKGVLWKMQNKPLISGYWECIHIVSLNCHCTWTWSKAAADGQLGLSVQNGTSLVSFVNQVVSIPRIGWLYIYIVILFSSWTSFKFHQKHEGSTWKKRVDHVRV